MLSRIHLKQHALYWKNSNAMSDIFSLYSVHLVSTDPDTTPILSTQNEKETRENRKQTETQWELFCKIWHMYIALLQFYKQMYNKYIKNRLLLWDSEEPACMGIFFSSSSICARTAGYEAGLLYEEYSYSSALRRPKSIHPM